MKKLLALLTALLLCLTLTGCKKNPYEHIENPIATITMEDGSTMRFELYLQVAPNTVANFTKLANDGFYDRMEFFRVVPGVLIQSGCPENSGVGHADHMIRGEFAANGVENDISHTRGVISMARLSGDENFDTASSQFFIMQGNYPEYDGNYAAFGAAMDAESLAVLDKIANRVVDAHNVPIARQRIATIRVNTHNWVLEPATIPFPVEAEEEKNTKK